MKKGFVILAQNTKDVDYIKCATALAKSIKKCMPEEKVVLITDEKVKNKTFDKIIKFPYGDQDKNGTWKLSNDWQVYKASPFDLTIKLEADLHVPNDISYWWDILSQRDLVISSHIRNYKQEISDVRYYRRFIDDNKLPDVYNAITYFKKSDLAEKFFAIVRNVFENWTDYKAVLKCNPNEEVTTDWAYAIACHILGKENTTMPQFDSMSMVHMKAFINNTAENWTDSLVYELLPHTFRINTFPQRYPVHYHIKNFADKILKAYD